MKEERKVGDKDGQGLDVMLAVRLLLCYCCHAIWADILYGDDVVEQGLFVGFEKDR